MVPTLYQRRTGRSLNVYLFLLRRLRAYYLFYGIRRSLMYWIMAASSYWSLVLVDSSGLVREG
jgi:hypothetical protein